MAWRFPAKISEKFKTNILWFFKNICEHFYLLTYFPWTPCFSFLLFFFLAEDQITVPSPHPQFHFPLWTINGTCSMVVFPPLWCSFVNLLYIYISLWRYSLILWGLYVGNIDYFLLAPLVCLLTERVSYIQPTLLACVRTRREIQNSEG